MGHRDYSPIISLSVDKAAADFTSPFPRAPAVAVSTLGKTSARVFASSSAKATAGNKNCTPRRPAATAFFATSLAPSLLCIHAVLVLRAVRESCPHPHAAEPSRAELDATYRIDQRHQQIASRVSCDDTVTTRYRVQIRREWTLESSHLSCLGANWQLPERSVNQR